MRTAAHNDLIPFLETSIKGLFKCIHNHPHALRTEGEQLCVFVEMIFHRFLSAVKEDQLVLVVM